MNKPETVAHIRGLIEHCKPLPTDNLTRANFVRVPTPSGIPSKARLINPPGKWVAGTDHTVRYPRSKTDSAPIITSPSGTMLYRVWAVAHLDLFDPDEVKRRADIRKEALRRGVHHQMFSQDTSDNQRRFPILVAEWHATETPEDATWFIREPEWTHYASAVRRALETFVPRHIRDNATPLDSLDFNRTHRWGFTAMLRVQGMSYYEAATALRSF